MLGSVIFAALSAPLDKTGIMGAQSNLETEMCSVGVLMVASMTVAVTRKAHEGRTVSS